MAKKKVFISYRRDDAAGFSHAIHDRLVEFLPDERVFMDVHGIETGADFSKRLEAALAQCGVLLVLIGKRWAGSDESGSSSSTVPAALTCNGSSAIFCPPLFNSRAVTAGAAPPGV